MPPNKNSRKYRIRAREIAQAQFKAGMALRAYAWDLIENHDGGNDDIEQIRTHVECGAHIATRLKPEALEKYRKFQKENAPPSYDELESMEWEDDPEMGERFTKAWPIMPTPFPDPATLVSYEDVVNFRVPERSARPQFSPSPVRELEPVLEPEPEPEDEPDDKPDDKPEDEAVSLPRGSKNSDSISTSTKRPQPDTSADDKEPSPKRARSAKSQSADRPPTRIRFINRAPAGGRLVEQPAAAPAQIPPHRQIFLKIKVPLPTSATPAQSTPSSHGVSQTAIKPSSENLKSEDPERKPSGRPTRIAKEKAINDITNQYEINQVTGRPVSRKRKATPGRGTSPSGGNIMARSMSLRQESSDVAMGVGVKHKLPGHL
ncbi:hypothetical protein B0T19DRAFT_395074 [Cercophora scortea]|uniref:Uncharacterized protein n=1 Tax=Cercophora scortea TaxID=314031 RepID=A0AAE0J1H7_9PEZI|nr:hypothetical protein B0T19DRAFT_395074 [Cercophora scortea]